MASYIRFERCSMVVLSVMATATATATGCVGQMGDDRPNVSANSGTGGTGTGGAGQIGLKPPGVVVDPPVVIASCSPEAAVDAPLRRLTAIQFRNSMRDLVAYSVNNDMLIVKAIMSDKDVADSFDTLPKDARPQRGAQDLYGDFRRLDQNIDYRWVKATAAVAGKVGIALARPASLRMIAPCAATATGADLAVCVDKVINTFGARALRMPQLSAELLKFYRDVYFKSTAVIDQPAFADLLGALIGSPQFTYMVEQGSVVVAGRPGVYALTAGELATRLSFGYWNSIPDNLLWDAVKSGDLLTADGYKKQLDRIIADPRTSIEADIFFTEWLQLDFAEEISLDALKKNARYMTLLGPDISALPTRSAINKETLDFARYVAWTKGGTFDDLLTSEAATIQDKSAARFFGTARWDGVSVPPSFLAGTRRGLLTRPGILAKNTAGREMTIAGDTQTHPIPRGAFLRKEILCDELPDPPANALQESDKLREEAAFLALEGTRKQWEYLTEKLPECRGCHQAFINGLGFAFEGYDALGRVRKDEPIFTPDGTRITKRVDVDPTKVVPRIVAGDSTEVSGAAELTKLIQSTGKAARCFARTYYSRYLLGRSLSLSDSLDSTKPNPHCVVDSLAKANPTIKDLLKQMATLPAFQQRNFGDTL